MQIIRLHITPFLPISLLLGTWIDFRAPHAPFVPRFVPQISEMCGWIAEKRGSRLADEGRMEGRKEGRDGLERGDARTQFERLLPANLLFAGACPLLCKSASRLRQTVDNGGIVVQVGEPHGVASHPIVSVPNQPEIPAFVASVFTSREERTRQRACGGEREEEEGEELAPRGEIMLALLLLLIRFSWRYSFIIEGSERRKKGRRTSLPVSG